MSVRDRTKRRLASLAVLSGCVLIAHGAGAAQPPGFDDYAGQGYQEISTFAASQAHNPALAKYFADRAQAVRAGKAVPPLLVSQTKLDEATMREATKARLDLTSRLDNGARLTAPMSSAVAQVNFDCWLVQFKNIPGGRGEVRGAGQNCVPNRLRDLLILAPQHLGDKKGIPLRGLKNPLRGPVCLMQGTAPKPSSRPPL